MSGILKLANGGSNANLTASNGGIVWSNATQMQILSGTATAGQMLQSGSNVTPAWSTTTYPATNAINTLLYASSANVMSALATANNGVLITSNSGAPSWLANSSTPGYVLTANSGAPPSWQAGSASGFVTGLNGDSGSATPSAGIITVSGGATGLTTSGSGSTLSLTGTLAVTHGGTGVTSVTTTPTATAFAGWDANLNFTANNMISEMTSTVSSGSSIVLTVASTQIQNATGSTAQTVQMPVVSTLPRIGFSYTLLNNTSALMTVVSSGSNTIGTITAGNSATIYCTALTGTTATSWFMFVPGFTPSAFSAVNDTNVTATLTGFPTVALLANMTFTLGWTGQLGLTRGGTNSSLTASNGGIVYSNASQLAILSGTTTAQQLLVSGASTTPQWTTTTYPLTNAINTIMYASSANVLGSIAAANDGVLITSNSGVPSFLANSGTAGYVLTANSGGPPSWQNTQAPAAAAQSDMVAATSTTVYSSPGRQQYHPGHPKAWVSFSGSTLNASFNVTSVTVNSTGNYTVTLTVPFSSANYAVVTGQILPQSTGTGKSSGILELASKATGSFVVTGYTYTGSTNAISASAFTEISCACFGGQ